MCEIYLEKNNTVSNFWVGDNVQSEILERDQKKWMPGGQKEFIPQILLCFLSKKTKYKCIFEDSIPNVDLSLATKQPINI